MQTARSKASATNAGEMGSAIIAALVVIGILALMAATFFLRAMPAYRTTYQASAWQEARLAADAGIDYGMAAIQNSLPQPDNYTWPTWTLSDGSPISSRTDEPRLSTPPSTTLIHLGDGNARPAVVKVAIDVLTRDDNVSRNPWFRIRATGSAALPSSQLSLNKRDLFLRRMNLKQKRITRTVEVVARPLYLWEYALKTKGQLVLGGGTTWVTDSYDSRYSTLTASHRGSTNGMYDATKAGAFGNIASNLQRPANSPYGPLIDAEGALVRGEVQTHGGDNPDTAVHENVEESDRIDQSRITNEFDETLLPPENPTQPGDPTQVRRITAPWGTPDLTNPNLAVPLPSSFTRLDGSSAGTSVTNPVRIKLAPTGNSQGGFSVAAPSPLTATRFVEIYINANLILGGSIPAIQVPPNVHAKIFVNGNLDFKNQDINYSSSSSRIPGNVQIYGVSTSPAARVDSSGNGHLVTVFYGPQYAGHLDGNTEIIGGFVLDTYDIAGGGGSGGDSVGAGFHYDEALGVVGPIQAYKVVGYFEDTRKDLD
ncbi:MAG TPA: hypothetical protein VFD27_07420 [Chthoniobacteraceae bacterium]|nr:hypothetical protein [Chthoniobacteraceae bacterium]